MSNKTGSPTRFDDYYAIIPHPSNDCILLLNSEQGWTLPQATVPLSPDDGRWRDAFRVNSAFQQSLGITITMLECLFVSPFPSLGQHGSSVFAMSNHDVEWVLPSHGAWVSYEKVATLPLIMSEHRHLIEQWWMKTHSLVPDRLPWTQNGWFEEASAWIHAQLSEQGISVTGPIEQTRSWFISSLLRLPTTIGEVYFKAVPTTDVHEPLLTQMIASQYISLAPHVLAVHQERRWLLMKAVVGKKLTSNANPDKYLPRLKRLLFTYAQMQYGYTKYIDQFLALGCHDWRLEKLIEDIDPFFAELLSVLQGSRNPLTYGEQEALQSVVPRLKTLCTELLQLGTPASLHHGDFHRGNILVNERECILLDWSGFVGVTHPFLSLWLPLSDWDQETGQQLVESYLEVWSDIAPVEDLRAAVAKAHPLAALCGALGHRYQLAHARTALSWDILSEQENLLECLRSLLSLM